MAKTERGPTTRVLAIRAVLASVTIGGVLTVAAALLAMVVSGFSLNGFFLGLFVAAATAALTAVLAPQFVIKRLHERYRDHNLQPGPDGRLIGVCFLVLGMLLAAALLGDRTGSSLNLLAAVSWTLALVVGLVAIVELLHHRWSTATTSVKPSAVLAGACGAFLVVAALPAVLLARDTYTNLPVAVIDEQAALSQGWRIESVADYAPENALIQLARDDGTEAGVVVYVRISHHANRCGDSYECTPAGTTQDGSEILSLTRKCGNDRSFAWPNLLVKRPKGKWEINSHISTRYCGEEATPVTLDELQQVVALLEPSAADDFATFVLESASR